jgi:threonine dehydrogenase-like Zn-dependent dehydrogenase
LTATGSKASMPAAWMGALALMAAGGVDTQRLISRRFPVTEWRKAFDISEQKVGVKTLLTAVEDDIAPVACQTG